MAIREKDIVFETKTGCWVLKDTKNKCYTVYRTGVTHSKSDSSYPLDDDGLSLAICRCKYLDKRESNKSRH